MTRHIVQRLSETVLVLAVMSFVFYALIGLMPGDPIDIMVQSDPNLTPADARRLKALYGLDRPIPLRYWAWVQAALSGDMGYSRVHARPVLEIILPFLGNTLVLMGVSFVAAILIAIPKDGIQGFVSIHRTERHANAPKRINVSVRWRVRPADVAAAEPTVPITEAEAAW